MKNGGKVTAGMRDKYRQARDLVRAYRSVDNSANDPPRGQIEVKYIEAVSLFITEEDLPEGVVITGISGESEERGKTGNVSKTAE